MRRPVLFIATLAIAFSLACAGLGERIREGVATQVEIAIAENMGVDPSEIEITPKGDRWRIDTPEWDANCGFIPAAKRPRGFAFTTDGNLLADCKVGSACRQVFGVPCGRGGKLKLGMALVLHEQGVTRGARLAKRREELEAKGWTVTEKVSPENADATIMSAMKGKVVRAAAVVAEGDRGHTVEVLVAPIQ